MPLSLRDGPVAWIDVRRARDPATQTMLLTTALEHGFSHIVIPAERRDELVALGRFQPLLVVADGNGPGDAVVAPDAAIGRWVTLHDKHDEAAVSSLAGQIDHVVVAATDWKIIPLENLIADYQPTRSLLLAEVRDAAEAAVMLSTLEVGTDGVVLAPAEPQDIIDLARLLEEQHALHFELEEAEILAITDAGNGDRVCIDTCSLLHPGEGMLIGGSSQGLFLLHSESLESPYVNARPFRVNAGAVYAYVMGTNGKTHYLSELHAGMPVLAIDAGGNARTVTVGRAKVETRPLLLVEAAPVSAPGSRYSVVVQNAETIRFVTPGGGALSVADARPGDRVLLSRSDKARHFGRPIKERILER